MTEDITISVVVPTRDRVEFLKRAIFSVLKQSYLPTEIIVVIDGVSKKSKQFLEEISKITTLTIKYTETQQTIGGSEARNKGARMSSSDLIAFLDDDDEWYSTKLYEQISLINVNAVSLSSPFLCFTSLHTYNHKDDSKYKKLPNIDYRYSGKSRIIDYLFETKGLKNIGFIQTSTIIVPRWLVIETPFTKKLEKHQDWDWLLKLEEQHSMNVLQVESPKVIYHSDAPTNKRVGYSNKWSVTKDFYLKWESQFSENGKRSFYLNYLVLGISEMTELDIKKRIKMSFSLLKSLPKKDLYSLYTLKTLTYIGFNIFKK